MSDAVAQEFHALLVRVLDEQASPDELTLFNLILEERADLTAVYREQMRLHVLLRQLAATQAMPAPSRRRRVPLAARLAVAAAAALLVSTAAVLVRRAPQPPSAPAAALAARQARQPGATLRRTPERAPVFAEVLDTAKASGLAETADGTVSAAFEKDEWVALRRLRLDTGSLTLALGSSVTLTATAPIDLEFQDEKRVVLHAGHLLARVGAQGHGFEVRTPHHRIIDLGTVFAARVFASGAANVAVLKGAVVVKDLANRHTCLLHAGEGAYAGPAGNVAPFSADALAAAAATEAGDRTPASALMETVLKLSTARAIAPEEVPPPPERFERRFDALADAYIEQSVPDGNTGSSPTHWVKNHPSYQRELFLTFALPQESVRAYQVVSARVVLYRYTPPDSRGDDVPLTFQIQDDTGWDERGITWNHPPPGVNLPSATMPNPGAVIAQDIHVPAASGSAVEVDVSPHVRAAIAAGKDVFGVHVYASTSANLSQYFFAREAPDETLRPALRVTLTDRPVNVSAHWDSEQAAALAWTAHTASEGYVIQCAGAADGPFETLGASAEPSFTDTTAAFGTRSYYYRVAAALNGNRLSPFSEVVTPGAIERAREPVADAFVKDGAFANTPQGGAAVLEVRNNADGIGDARESVLRFDVSGMAFAESASLRLYYKSLLNGNITFSVRRIAESTPPWNENSVTWNGLKYTAGMALPTLLGASDPDELARYRTDYYPVGSHLLTDVTGEVRGRAAAEDPALFQVVSLTPGASGKHLATFASREEPLASRRPALLYTANHAPLWLRADAEDGAVSLSWQPQGGAAATLLQRSRAADGPWETLAFAQEGAYADTDVVNGARYLYRVASRTATGYVGPFSEAVAATPLPVAQLTATADASVADGSRAARALGLEQELPIKSCTLGESRRETFLRFAFPSRRTVVTATLRLTVARADSDVTNTVVAVESVPDFSAWQEDGLSWDGCAAAGLTLPSAGAARPNGTLLAHRQCAHLKAGDTLTLDVTEAARDAQAQRRPLVLHLYAETPGDNKSLSFASKEHSTLAGAVMTYQYRVPPQGTLIRIQ